MMKSRYQYVSLFLLIAAAISVVPCTAEEKSPSGLATGDACIPLIHQRMGQFIEDKQIAGAVTLVTRRGCIVHLDAVGCADVEEERPMKEDSLFAIASMTKPITATAVMILQDEGKLSIDDPVSKYLPEFNSVSLPDGPPSRQITIRDLMTHTSGVVGSQRCESTLAETASAIAARPLGFQPGSRWQYSPGLNVCGRIIEIASGKSYDQFLKERIFEPLKMVDTTFCPTPQQRKRLARIYKPGEDKASIVPASHWLTDDAGQRAPNPSGGLVSTASDMAGFYQMILNGGELDGRRIVSKAAVEKMTRLQTGELTTGFTPGNCWGLGWCVVREPQGVTKMLSPGTFGHGGAFGTQGWVDPEREMIFVLMIQRSGFGNSDAADVRGAFQEIAIQAVGQ